MTLVVSNPVDKKKIKDALFEISNSYTRIDAEKELIKDIVEDLADKFELPKKHINKIARAYHKRPNEMEIYNNILEIFLKYNFTFSKTNFIKISSAPLLRFIQTIRSFTQKFTCLLFINRSQSHSFSDVMSS